jgi:hypothetical protein
MEQQNNFTRESFLRRFVISQLLLAVLLLSIFSLAKQNQHQQVGPDAEKEASKAITAKTIYISPGK